MSGEARIDSIYFVQQLEQAYLAGKGLTFGNKNFSADDIQTIVNTLDIVVFPQANPDGRNYSMTVDPMWRKNRRTQAPNSSHGDCVGVDINRNYDFLWDFLKYFNPMAPVATSDKPCDPEVYCGPSAFSNERPGTQSGFSQLPQYPLFYRFAQL